MKDFFSNINHPLVRDGRSQSNRLLTNLSPENIKVDDRSMEEILEYIFNYAQQVNFINPQNFDLSHQDNWINFFKNSDAFQLAIISRFDFQKIKTEYNNIFKKITVFSQPDSLNILIDIIVDAIFQIANWQEGLKEGNSQLKATIGNIISTNLAQALKRLIGCINVARQWGYEPKQGFQNLDWGLTHDDFFDLEENLKGKGISKKQKIIRTQAKLDQIFQVAFKAIREIVESADDSLQLLFDENNNLQNQPPHLGLLFAFLRIFDEVRADFNKLSSRHLEFFYNKVLKLDPKAPVADKTHLVFELAKHIDDHKLEKGIFFKAGKDDLGNEVQFQLEEEVILNKTKVEHLQTLYLDQCPKKINCLNNSEGDLEYLVSGVYAASKANSLDGQGEDFQVEKSSWETLGFDNSKKNIREGLVDEYTQKHPFAISGMLLTSPVLLLQEGKRVIKIKFDLNTSEIDDCIRKANGTLEGEGTELKKAIEAEAFLPNDGSYISFDEEVIKELPKQGMAPEIANYFEKFVGKAFTKTQLDQIIDERFPTDKKNANAFKTDKDILLSLSKTDQLPFELLFTGEKGWLPPSDLTMACDTNLTTLEFTATLNPEDDAVTFFDAELLEEDYDTKLPAVKILLNQSIQFQTPNSETACLWHYFSKFRITQATINVEVCGVKNLIVQNDDGLMQVGKPIYPFGTIPRQEDNFYIGSREVFCKNWDQVQVNLGWEKAPNTINDIYKLYSQSPPTKNSFELLANLLENNDWGTSVGSFPMFDNRKTEICPSSPLQHITFDKIDFPNAEFTEEQIFETFNEFNSESEKGFLRLQLNNSGETVGDTVFLHEEYAKVVARQALAKSYLLEGRIVQGAAFYNNGNETNPLWTIVLPPAPTLSAELPDPPYTPIIKEISIDYTASAKAYADSLTEISTVNLIHLYPYQGNYKEEIFPEFQNPIIISTFPRFVPHFENEGHLFVGLKDLEPGSNLTLLFKMAESTGNTDVEKADVTWYYLSDNIWKELKKDTDVLSDETEGLVGTGIVKFSIPWDITDKNTVLPKDVFWLMATAPNRTAAISETMEVHTQAARVIFVNKDNDLTRLTKPLEAETISKLVISDSSIKKVEQLYESFDATPLESDEQYYIRISEHLRHKGRGLNLFDYETLVLANFLEIYKIKCITHTLGRRGKPKDFEMSPGYVTIAVVPQLIEDNANLNLTPKASHKSLNDIYQFLKKRISPFIRLKVLNPIYEEILVSCEVKFVAGKSEDFYAEQLKTEIQQFLAPWAFGEQGQIAFGGRVFKSSIIDFIEQKDYVDYLIKFEMRKKNGEPQNEIIAATARSILTTGEHTIIPLKGDCILPDEKEKCCDYTIGASIEKQLKIRTPL